MTVFLTTHYLEEADGSDRVAIINYGKIVALDTPDLLKKSLGPEVLSVIVSDKDALRNYLLIQYPVLAGSIREEPDGAISFPMPSNRNESPWEMLRKIPFQIIQASIRRPNLDDVFIKYTGGDLYDSGSHKEAEAVQ